MNAFFRSLNWRLAPIQVGVLVTFALIPAWLRFPINEPPPLGFTSLYVTRFFILLPMVWTIGWWLVLGLPGFAVFRRDTVRATWALALLALAIWAYASSGWALVRVRHPEVAQTAALQLGVVVLFVIIIASAGPPARAIVAALVFSLVWNSVIAALQVANQGSTGLACGEFSFSVLKPGVSVIQSGNLRWLRPYGCLPHPNILAGVMAIGLLAVVAWLTAPQRALRWLGTLIFLFGVWCFLLTFSRGAWLGFAAGAFAMYPLLRRTSLKVEMPDKGFKALVQAMRQHPIWRHVGLTLALTVIMGLAFFIMYRPLLAARAGIGEETTELRSVSDRIVFTNFAVEAIVEQPLQGLGIDNFPWYAARALLTTGYDLQGDHVHNVLMSALAELGIIGYLLVVIAFVCGVEMALRSIKTASFDSALSTQHSALLGGFMALTVIGLIDHYPWTLIQFQVAWWGLLAAAIAKPSSDNQPTFVQA